MPEIGEISGKGLGFACCYGEDPNLQALGWGGGLQSKEPGGANLQAQPDIRSLSAALLWLPSALAGSPEPGLEFGNCNRDLAEFHLKISQAENQ